MPPDVLLRPVLVNVLPEAIRKLFAHDIATFPAVQVLKVTDAVMFTGLVPKFMPHLQSPVKLPDMLTVGFPGNPIDGTEPNTEIELRLTVPAPDLFKAADSEVAPL